MAKTKIAVSGNPFGKKLLASFKKYWFVWVASIGLVGFFGIYRPVSVYLDKQRFLQAEKEIEKVAEQIQAKIGPANQVKKDNYCRYASRKFERGPRSCVVQLHFLYENHSLEEINGLLDGASSIFGTKPYDDIGRNTTGKFVPIDDQNRGEQDLSQELSDISGLGCGVQYFYPAKASYQATFDSNYQNSLKITAWCSDGAKAEHFPVTD